MKNLLNLKGAEQLSQKKLETISGGKLKPYLYCGEGEPPCPPGSYCVGSTCRYIVL